MANEPVSMDQHMGEWLSGFVDGELTQQQRQRVTLHCEQCDQCRDDLAELKSLRTRIGKADFGEAGEDKWRENMIEPVVRNTRSLGWLLMIAGVLVIAGIVLVSFITDPGMSVGMKLVIGAIYGGLVLLLVSVIRQRLIERKTDKYKDVEI